VGVHKDDRKCSNRLVLRENQLTLSFGAEMKDVEVENGPDKGAKGFGKETNGITEQPDPLSRGDPEFKEAPKSITHWRW
jgi:hypothetical protein